MTTVKRERDLYIAERMQHWRASAQCQCAVHATTAMRDAADSFDGLQKFKEWFNTPDGKKAKLNMARLVKRLERQQQEARKHPLKGIHNSEIKDKTV